ncbi:MAG: hypothetical protein A3E01_15340 [Gammaproteobacteria bacterium RIFCSPHIGHO2_12_FULL_63_22]|nr:MAG: hypothetical protein A3E01_15340 [Gammaproteobacteria bacterium RIFCSPHIGHO2_12_FULL_63_22]
MDARVIELKPGHPLGQAWRGEHLVFSFDETTGRRRHFIERVPEEDICDPRMLDSFDQAGAPVQMIDDTVEFDMDNGLAVYYWSPALQNHEGVRAMRLTLKSWAPRPF